MNKEELKERASAALSIGVAAAKKFGDAACELGKEGVAAAKAKAQEMREAREAQKAKASAGPTAATCEAPLAGLAGFGAANNESQVVRPAQSSFDGASDAADKRFIIRGWLLVVYWLFNLFYFILCISLAVSWADSWDMKDRVWVPIVALPILLFFNRLWYEVVIAIFEIVKHLRQIRDELRKANAVSAIPDAQQRI